MTTVPLEYIEVDDRGVAKLIGHRIKVRHLVGAMRASGYTAERLAEAYPDLGLDVIFAALAYYHAHKEVIDRELEAEARFAAEMRAKNPNRHTRAELEARWRERFPDRPLPSEVEPAGE